ncbi:DEAD/DEAH box helicase [Candidatus Woesearchaeota archaeon]|nr:DEAD/DEAH box helicase [Candidatus Woesearchaeota archaeon]
MQFNNYTLDKFQEEAIEVISHAHSVLVSAPTGSGKTLIADYIIDKDLKEGKRVIYTAPIKALSNQKYEDFCKQYGEENIGLVTGDIVINSRAPVLIMTTEVYRNMVIVKDPAILDVRYCIMDEIHYLGDPERGYVWEESIIFSPDNVRFLLLSATIPNADELASWIESIKHHKVHVIRHDERPVPLSINYYDADLGVTSIAEIKRRKNLDNIPHYGKREKREEFLSLTKELKDDEKLPCIYFAFSRAKTQDYALKLAKQHDFLSHVEKQEISLFIVEEFKKLSNEAKSLKTAQDIRQCLPRGIAFHNAGMLPELKHIVEKLFSKSLIKVLFATETFAVGINMPAKTVVFDSLRKYTAQGFRYLTSREFYQIAGRAGRRGIDKEGLAIAIINRRLDDIVKIHKLTTKTSETVKSQFKLTYNTVLNMIHRHSDEEIINILSQNLYTFQQSRRKLPSDIKARYDKILKTLTRMNYVKGHALTELGKFTTHIFSNELEISQIFCNFIEIDEYSILLLLATIVYEPRREVEFYRNYSARNLIIDLKKHSYLRLKKWDIMHYLSAIIMPLIEHKTFIEIMQNTSMPEGDLIRFYMQLLDKLEQVDRASTDYSLRMKVQTCKQLIRDCLKGMHLF